MLQRSLLMFTRQQRLFFFKLVNRFFVGVKNTNKGWEFVTNNLSVVGVLHQQRFVTRT
jgi:hypothetical protein